MSITVGLWIDQTRAVIAFGEGNRRGLKLINSNIKERPKEASVSMPAEDIRQLELTGQLDHYYDEVVLCVCEAASILMFGPVEAKGELTQRLEKNNYRGTLRRYLSSRDDDRSADDGLTRFIALP